MELLELGDDELLEVLSYLRTKELLGCRVVCRRWRSLALHPLLWRNKSLAAAKDHNALVGAVLRLAPCLKSLTFNSYFEECAFLLGSTCCAVSELRFYEVSSTDAVCVAMVLARQESLGRLRTVSFYYKDDENVSTTRFRLLLQQLLRTAGLESIFLETNSKIHPEMPALLSAAEDETRVPASLRRLVYYSRYGRSFPDPYLLLRLEWHATTLEEVKINQHVPGAASLLAAMPRLHTLHCPLLENMAPMAQCRTLKSLHLHVDLNEDTRLHLPGVETFLRSAVTHLDELQLVYDEGEKRADAVNLVLSIGGRGKQAPALRSLKFRLDVIWESTTPLQLRPLSSILPRLPHLTVLDIGGVPSDDFLSALDGEVLPELEQLFMYTPVQFCQHEFAHSRRMNDILLAYPRLHVRLRNFDWCPLDKCDFCRDHTCHSKSRNDGYIVFTHPLDAGCEVRHAFYGMGRYRDIRIELRLVSAS